MINAALLLTKIIAKLLLQNHKSDKDHFVNALSHWKTVLHCNVISHWLGAYTKRFPDLIKENLHGKLWGVEWPLQDPCWEDHLVIIGVVVCVHLHGGHLPSETNWLLELIEAFGIRKILPLDLPIRHAKIIGACRCCPRANKILWLPVRLDKTFFSLGMYLFFHQYTSALEGLYKYWLSMWKFLQGR